MTLPTPNLDDRNFQQLVDEAKRLVQQRCPEWTDHNVSDPGVTLIETFAFMADMLLYRLNRVPDRNYIKFLELIGVRLFPPTAARAPATFWLSASQEDTILIPAAMPVATERTEHDDAVIFATVADLAIIPCHFEAAATMVEGGSVVRTTDTLAFGQGFSCFSPEPRPNDVVLIGLSDPVPSCAVALYLDCQIEGVGVDPLDPPLRWEAWDGDGWSVCEVDHDDTGGLNRAGEIVLHIPPTHAASVIDGGRAGWVRARVTEPYEGQPFFSASPKITRIAAETIGGTVEVLNSELVTEETVGLSEGVPAQRFELQRGPLIASREPITLLASTTPVTVEVAGGSGWQQWTEVDTFAQSGPDDLHFVLDRVTGEIVFGPAVREMDGTLHAFGAVPPKGSPIRIPAYRVGGGRRGNVAAGQINVLKETIPFVSSVTNRVSAIGGVDAESIDAAKVRGPILLRTRNRAVTVEDYEQLAREAAPEVGRVRAVSAAGGAEAGSVRILVVPAVADGADNSLRFEQLVPAEETLAEIAEYLDERRCVGARVSVEPPTYQGVTVVAKLQAAARANPRRLQQAAVAALNHYFHPLRGGASGEGWPFGRPIHAGEVYAVLQRIPGCEFVEDARLFGADPITGQRGEQTQRIDIDPNALVFSYNHQVLVEA